MNYGNTPLDRAVELANLFEEHAIYFGGIAHLSKDGWDIISEKYGEVYPELRASVMNDFMKELTKRGIEYDISEFQEKPE